MNLQQISQLLNIDFSEMKLQSGFNKLSKNQYYITPNNFVVKLSNNDKYMIVCNHQQVINLIQTELSFTTDNLTLINELKLIIDRDNLKAY